MFSRFAISVATLLFLAGCQSTGSMPPAADTGKIPDGFQTVKISGLDEVYIAQGADLSTYSAVLLPPLNVDVVEIKQLSSNRLPYRRDWELTEEDKKLLQETFSALMLEELAADNGFAIAHTAAENTLEVQVILDTIAPNAPKDDFDSRPSARSSIYSEGFGDVGIRMEVSDSLSGRLLISAKDKKRGNTIWRLNNRVSNWSEVRRMLRSWSVQIRNGLDELKADHRGG